MGVGRKLTMGGLVDRELTLASGKQKEKRMISIDDMHSENIWFSWYKPSKYREKLIRHAWDGRTDERTDGKWKIEQCSVGPETAIINGQINQLPSCYSRQLKAHFTSHSPRWPTIQRLWADETTRGSSPPFPGPSAALAQPWFQRWSDFRSVHPNVHLSSITSTGDVEQMWLRGRRLARADS